MDALREIADLFARAAQLLAFSLAPLNVSPSFRDASALVGAGSALVLALIVFAAVRLAKRAGGLAAQLAGGLVCLAVAASVASAVYFQGPRGPLGVGVALVAPALWLGLALTAAVAAQRTLGSRLRPLRFVAPALVLAFAAGLFGRAAPFLGTRERLWQEALRRDGDDRAALAALTAPFLAKREFDEAAAVVAACVEQHPRACACLAARAEIELAAHQPAVRDAREAFDTCDDARTRGAWAEALLSVGDATGGAREAARALQDGAPAAHMHYLLSIALARQRKEVESLLEAQQAVDLGGGHDEQLNLAAVAIAANQLDRAEAVLGRILAADPHDATALYDHALVADRRGNFNAARNGYLAALEADRTVADARYNLALLVFRRQIYAEALHHAQRFNTDYPKDPRGIQLLSTVTTHP